MGGQSSGQDFTVQQASLMSDEQRKFLDQMLQGVRGQITGFKIGEGYKGPAMANYSPKAFTMPAKATPTYENDRWWRDRRERDGGKEGRDAYYEGDDYEEGRFGHTDVAPDNPTAQGPSVGPSATPDPSMVARVLASVLPGMNPGANSPWASFLNSNPTKPTPTKSLSELMTRPMISPFTRGLTGNAPRG